LGDLVELGELSLGLPAALFPEVELVEVPSEGLPLVDDLVEGGGELLVADLASGVGTDDAGFFEVEFVEASGDGCSLVALLGFGLGGCGDVTLRGCSELVGVAE
jgi:hypothetical protein